MTMDAQRQFQQFWSERAPRERRILTLGGLFLLALALYFALIAPAANGIGRLQRLLPQTGAQAAELEALVAEAKSLRGLPPVGAPGMTDARAAIATSLEAAGLQAAHNVPTPNGDLHLSFVDVPYSKWATWLATAEKTLGVHAIAVTVKAAATPGNTDIELTLRQPRA
jgi:general secretion pathway protein M